MKTCQKIVGNILGPHPKKDVYVKNYKPKVRKNPLGNGIDEYDDNGEVYARPHNLEQMKILLEEWGYKNLDDFKRNTGVKPEDLIGQFIFVQGESHGNDRVFTKDFRRKK